MIGAARLFGATGVLGRNEAGEGHETRCIREAAGVAEFGGDREGGEIVDAAETAQPLDPRAQGLDGQQIPEFELDGVQTGDGFINGSHVGPMRLLKRGQRPALSLEPLGVALGPRAFGGGEATAMAQEKVREAVPGAQQIRADIFAAAK